MMDADSGEILWLENPQYAMEKAFPPGSLLKVFSALYGLKENIMDPAQAVSCNGFITIHGQKLKCWNTAGHGAVNLYKALAYSCNVYFYHVGQRVNGADYIRFLHSFGIGGHPVSATPDEGSVPYWNPPPPWTPPTYLLAAVPMWR